MSSSPTNQPIKAPQDRYLQDQHNWDVTNAERLRVAVANIRQAAKDFTEERVKEPGWSGGMVRPVVERYQKYRQWSWMFTASYYKQWTHDCTVWKVKGQTCLYVGIDRELYTSDPPNHDYLDKHRRPLVGLHVLSDECIIDMIGEWGVAKVDSLIMAIRTGKAQQTVLEPEFSIRVL